YRFLFVPYGLRSSRVSWGPDEYNVGTGVRQSELVHRASGGQTSPGDVCQPAMCLVVPASLVAGPQITEADPAPPIGKLTREPGRLDLEPDLAGLEVLAENEPLRALLDVPCQRIVAKPEGLPSVLLFVPNRRDHHSRQVV